MEMVFGGIDIGTSSVKTAIFDQKFNIIFSDSRSYSLYSKKGDRAELDPEEVFQAVKGVLENCIMEIEQKNKKIDFFSFSSALHSLVVVDKQDHPLTRCITWADTRAGEFNSQLEDFYSQHNLYQKTGCPVHAMYWPAKILWLKKYSPRVFEKAQKYISIKEYVIQKLSGQYVVDYSLASGSGLFNIHQKKWEKKILNYLGIKKTQLSEAVDGKKTVKIKKNSLTESKDLSLVLGSGDGPLANLGSQNYSDNSYVATIGTSGAIRVFSEQPVLSDNQSTWCYMLDEENYLPGGAINNGGIVLRWLMNNFFTEISDVSEFYQLIDQYIAEITPGKSKLLFLPFLTGERSPNWNSYARGLIIGLGLNHTTKDIAKAALEGIIFRMYSIFLALENMMEPCEKIIASGGFTNSGPWMQLMADIFGHKIVSYADHEASATGAAFMGAVATGYFDNYDDLDFPFAVKEIKKPEQKNHQKYQKIYQLHEKIYQKNSAFFEELSGLDKI